MIIDARPSAFTQLTTQADWERLFRSAGLNDGMDSAGSFAPSVNSGARTVTIGIGQCFIRGQLWQSDEPVITGIPAAAAQNRIDRLVIRYNRLATDAAGVVALALIQGTPAASPAVPALIRTDSGLWDLPVCRWTSASTGAITGLVDDRQFTGRTVMEMTSANRPVLDRPSLGMETDTGRVVFWNGTSWAPIIPEQDTWHDLRPASAGWSGSIHNEYPPQYRRTLDGNVHVFGILQLGTPYGNVNCFANPLPVAYRPAFMIRGHVNTIGNGSSAMLSTGYVQVLANGHFHLQELPTGLGGKEVYFNFIYPLPSTGLLPPPPITGAEATEVTEPGGFAPERIRRPGIAEEE